MTRQGGWRSVEMRDDEADYPDTGVQAHMFFDAHGSDETAFARLWATSSTAC